MTQAEIESSLAKARRAYKLSRSPAKKIQWSNFISALITLLKELFPESKEFVKSRPQLELGFTPKTSSRAPAKAK